AFDVPVDFPKVALR
ncbi:hypothetical protein WJ66_01153, partial [Stenotrophomonas maltophilia WJ66]